jgi:hydrogenase expression/formation protein HypC
MRVIECAPGYALCEGMGETRTIDMKLVGEQQPGTWVLVFLDAAREVVSAEQAGLVNKALEALNLATFGTATVADIDRLFPDLAGREPELPAHLKKQTAEESI